LYFEYICLSQEMNSLTQSIKKYLLHFIFILALLNDKHIFNNLRRLFFQTFFRDFYFILSSPDTTHIEEQLGLKLFLAYTYIMKHFLVECFLSANTCHKRCYKKRF